MYWTLSNQITLSRLALIPVFVLAFFMPKNWGYWCSAIVFTLAALTDWLDGYLARKRSEITAFGRFLDPVADKLLVATALVLLVEDGRAAGLLAVVIIGREIAIGAMREWLAKRESVIHVSKLGKWKAGMQMGAIIALLLHIHLFGINLHLLGTVLLWAACILTLWSGYQYMRDAFNELQS